MLISIQLGINKLRIWSSHSSSKFKLHVIHVGHPGLIPQVDDNPILLQFKKKHVETLLKERVTPVKRVTVGPPPVFTFYIISTFYLGAPWLLVSTMYLLCFNAYYLQVAVQSL